MSELQIDIAMQFTILVWRVEYSDVSDQLCNLSCYLVIPE